MNINKSIEINDTNHFSYSNTENIVLKYRIIDIPSEYNDHSIYEIFKDPLKSKGWISERLCLFPQEMTFQFLSSVEIDSINIISHESKISEEIDVYVLPSKAINYKRIGFFNFDSNMKTKLKARENKKVFLNGIDCTSIRLSFHKNHMNRLNPFNQIGIISLEFIGKYNNNPSEEDLFLLDRSIYLKQQEKDEFDETTKEKIDYFQSKIKSAVEREDFDEASKNKKILDRIKSYGIKMQQLEEMKINFISNEDYDNAKVMKNEITKLKEIIKSLDFTLPTGNIKKEGLKESHNEDEINEYPHIEKEEFDNVNQLHNKSISIYDSRGNITFDGNIGQTLYKEMEESKVEYDELVIPTLRNKNKKIENENMEIIKGELEELDVNIEKQYSDMRKFLSEEDMRKLFSKNILYREEGISKFINIMDSIFNDLTGDGNQINLTMKIIISQLNEKHPQISIKSIDAFEKLLVNINNLNDKPNAYDSSLTDTLLLKIKEKIGEHNKRIRQRAVMLYSFMLKQDFCDYNNLIVELIEDEIGGISNIDASHKQIKSSNVILGKLEIIETVFKQFDIAVKDKRTDITTFPFSHIIKYTCNNLSNPKSEVRRQARLVVKDIYNKFGYTNIFKKFINKVEKRELEKIKEDIPEVKAMLEKETKSIELSTKARQKSASSRESSGSRGKRSNEKYPSCKYCKRSDKEYIDKNKLSQHINYECVMFCNCTLCDKVVEVKRLNDHIKSECKHKEKYKYCNKCKELIENEIYENHIKSKKCMIVKGMVKCPLCKKEINIGERGFIQHLTVEVCKKQNRKYKI